MEEMTDGLSLIEGTEKLTEIFGRWPSFHDSEVLALGYERQFGKGFSILLIVDAYQTTSEVDERGYFRIIDRTQVTFRFVECKEAVLEDFGQQNVLFGIIFSADMVGGSPGLRVDLESISGLGGSIRCRSGCVVDATAITERIDGTFSYHPRDF